MNPTRARFPVGGYEVGLGAGTTVRAMRDAFSEYINHASKSTYTQLRALFAPDAPAMLDFVLGRVTNMPPSCCKVVVELDKEKNTITANIIEAARARVEPYVMCELLVE